MTRDEILQKSRDENTKTTEDGFFEYRDEQFRIVEKDAQIWGGYGLLAGMAILMALQYVLSGNIDESYLILVLCGSISGSAYRFYKQKRVVSLVIALIQLLITGYLLKFYILTLS